MFGIRIGGLLLLAFSAELGTGLHSTTTYPAVDRPADRMVVGVEVSDRPSAFVDLAKVARQFQKIGSDKPAAIDPNGWPKEDCLTVLFDDRAVPAWAPPIDDPDRYQPDESGTYSLSLVGQASISPAPGSPVLIAGLRYDSSTNTTKAEVSLPKGAPDLIVLQFTATKRAPGTAVDTGFTGLRVLRPGYSGADPPLFTGEFLRALKPFSYLRVMGWLDTNYQPGYYGDADHHWLRWASRNLPSDAIQGEPGLHSANRAICWEYLVLLANRLHKDLWINVPISATGSSPDDSGSYVYQLAELLKRGNRATGGKGLDPDLHIYLEHSNEVWNFGFPQYVWNKLAAEDEVRRGGSPLNGDGSTDHEQWARRRHALRLYQIARIFERVFGPGSLNTRVRPVYAAWTIQPDWYEEVLGWMDKTCGPPKSYFYALAETGYFNDQGAPRNGSVEQVLEAMKASSDAGRPFTTRLKRIAIKYGLKLADYEAGPDNGGGDPTNIGNRIQANRALEMQALVIRQFKDNFFDLGGDLATYFALSSAYSRYGCWGATDDLAHLDTPKFEAIRRLAH